MISITSSPSLSQGIRELILVQEISNKISQLSISYKKTNPRKEMARLLATKKICTKTRASSSKDIQPWKTQDR